MNSLVKTMLYWTIVLCIGAAVFVFFLTQSGFATYPTTSFHRMLRGTANRPFVYRQFLPLVGHLLSPVVPKRVARQTLTATETIWSTGFLREAGWTSYPSETVLILIMMYAALIAFVITMQRFVRDLGYSSRVQLIFPPMVLLGSAVFFIRFPHTYDLPLLLFFSLGLYLMYRQKWAWFLLVFACGTLNKETTIFLSLIFGLYYSGRMPRGQFMLLGASQLGIYALIQGVLRFIYRNNPGEPLEWHLGEQLPAYQLVFEQAPYLPVIWGAACLSIALLVIRGWSEKPLFVRVALAILPIFLVLFIFWAYPMEIRDLLEVFPVITILMLPPPTFDTQSHLATTAETPLSTSA